VVDGVGTGGGPGGEVEVGEAVGVGAAVKAGAAEGIDLNKMVLKS
jgi:hypothetical protein